MVATGKTSELSGTSQATLGGVVKRLGWKDVHSGFAMMRWSDIGLCVLTVGCSPYRTIGTAKQFSYSQ